jgi:vitamin B12 transporter
MSSATDLAGLLSGHGFQLYTAGGNSTAYIRGIGSGLARPDYNSPILVMINGVRSGWYEMSGWALNNIERVEIIRGPAAVQYGPAVGGVVNIITKRGDGDFALKMQLGAGSFNRFDERLAFSGAAGGLDFAVGLANSRQGGDSSVGGGGDLPHSGYDGKYSADIDAGYTFLDNHRIGFHFAFSAIDNMEAASNGYPDLLIHPDLFAIYDQYRNHTTFSYTGKTNDERFSWLAEYSFGKNKSDSIGYLNDYSLDTHYPEPESASIYSNNIQQLKLQTTFDNKLFEITVGLDYLKHEYNNFYYSWYYGVYYTDTNVANIDDIAGYLLAKARLFNGKLILSLGARYDSYESTFSLPNSNIKLDNFMPSFGIAYLINDYIKLRANYSEGFRIPQASEIFGDQSYTLPNLALKPEETTNIEFGADISYNYLDASLTYFITQYKNKIYSVDIGNYIYQNFNLEKKVTYSGLEASFSFDIGKFFNKEYSLTPYIDLTLITTRRNRDRRPDAFNPEHPSILPYVPDLMANYGIKFYHPQYNFSALLNANYIGKAYSKDFNSYIGTPYPAPFHHFGGYTVVDLSVNKRLWDLGDRGHIYLVAELNNIFDEFYAYSMDFPMPGRNFYFGVGYEF